MLPIRINYLHVKKTHLRTETSQEVIGRYRFPESPSYYVNRCDHRHKSSENDIIIMVSSSLISSLLSVLVFSCLSIKGRSAVNQQQKNTASYYEQQLTYAVEITHANLSANLNEWDADMAVMFYAPWCKYCKQLSPSWEQIAASTAGNKNLVVGKFNCEKPAENNELCLKIGIDRYPSVYFIGYGNLHQVLAGNPFAANPYPRIARYVADLYPQAIFDWVKMCAQISSFQRSWYDFKGIFTGKSRSANKVESLKAKVNRVINFESYTRTCLLSRRSIECVYVRNTFLMSANMTLHKVIALERGIVLLKNQVELYKSDNLAERSADNGDPFPLLAALKPDEVRGSTIYLFESTAVSHADVTVNGFIRS
jgi:thiol-disulfide isomerase/thioredoxin